MLEALRDCNFNELDAEDRTPLRFLCEDCGPGGEDDEGDEAVQVAVQLLSHGANPLTRDRHGDTPLLAAIRAKHLGLIRLLIATNPHCRNMYNIVGQHPLTVAAQTANVDAVRCRSSFPFQSSPELLTVCVCCRLLLESKAVPWASPVDGRTALHVAAQQGEADIVSLLLEHVKLRGGKESLSELLLLRDHNGKTAYSLAKKGGLASHRAVLDILEESQALVEGCAEPSYSFGTLAATDDDYMYFGTRRLCSACCCC